MQRPDLVEDQAKVTRRAQATLHNHQSAGISHFEAIERAKVECYAKSPYGKRFAIHHLKYPADDFPQRKFEAEKERVYDHYVQSCKVHVESRRERLRKKWNPQREGEAEVCWCNSWFEGCFAASLPVPPAARGVAVVESVIADF